jgi:hypothetical protein
VQCCKVKDGDVDADAKVLLRQDPQPPGCSMGFNKLQKDQYSKMKGALLYQRERDCLLQTTSRRDTRWAGQTVTTYKTKFVEVSSGSKARYSPCPIALKSIEFERALKSIEFVRVCAG